MSTATKAKTNRAPKIKAVAQWGSYQNDIWHKKNKNDVTLLYNYVERRKSFFLRAYMERKGYNYIDLGDHVYEDVSWGKRYGNRMECNPMYFTSGSLIKNLFKLHEESGLSKEEIAKKYVFLGGGGQCGPCRYGMYPQEYLKAANDAGFKGMRVLIFSSDLNDDPLPKESAFQFDLEFRINILTASILADLIHVAEMALRPHIHDKDKLMEFLSGIEQDWLKAFESPFYPITLPAAVKKGGKRIAEYKRREAHGPVELPLIFVTGEFFANLAHNEGNYNLRRFISDEGCEAIPGLMTQRILYDNWRRSEEAVAGMKYANTEEEREFYKKALKKQKLSTNVIMMIWNNLVKNFKPQSFGGRAKLLDFEEMRRLGQDYYHPHIFGGESHLEVAEALYYAEGVDGFISSKPFGCMPSSGVSDGVQAKIMSMHPELNFLSIETSGDNEASILSRVSMLLFKAKQKHKKTAMRKAEK